MVVASIVTRNNEPGLNALLWCIYFQTRKPDRIMITNTGKPLIDTQICSTINFISQDIPIEISTEKNPPHLGLVKPLFFKGIKDVKTLVWILEDDLVFGNDLLENQLEEETPNVPMYEEQGLEFDSDEKYTKMQVTGKGNKILLGCIYGLLSTVESFVSLKINFSEFKVGSDLLIIKNLKPTLVRQRIIHTKPKTFRSSTFALQEKLLMGDINENYDSSRQS